MTETSAMICVRNTEDSITERHMNSSVHVLIAGGKEGSSLNQ